MNTYPFSSLELRISSENRQYEKLRKTYVYLFYRRQIILSSKWKFHPDLQSIDLEMDITLSQLTALDQQKTDNLISQLQCI